MADPSDPAAPSGGGAADYGFRFACQRSGNCCSIPGGFVRVTEAEATAIAAHLDLPLSGFRSRYLDGSGTRLAPGAGPGCIFLAGGAEARCSIYPVRPERCRTWPFWPELRDNPEGVARAARMCPGIEIEGAAS